MHPNIDDQINCLIKNTQDVLAAEMHVLHKVTCLAPISIIRVVNRISHFVWLFCWMTHSIQCKRRNDRVY